MEREKRPFEDTKQFVRDVYEDMYLGELPLDSSQIDFGRPYRKTGEIYFQAEFGTTVMRAGDEIPLLMMPINGKPDSRTKTSKRRPNAALLYIFADPKTEFEPFQSREEIGKLYGVTYEQIRQDVSKNLEDLHKVVGEDLKQEYPLRDLITRRPHTLSSRINRSLSHGGSSLEIRQMVKEGSPTKDINREYGANKVSAARQTLRRWGMEAPPHTPQKDYGEIIRKVKDPDTTIEELRELIREFDNEGSISRYSAKKPGGVILSVSNLQFEAWGNRNYRKTKDAYRILKDAGIPVHTFTQAQNYKSGRTAIGRYFITFNVTKEETLKVLRDNSSGNRHIPVEQIAGEALESIPNTNQLFGTRKGEWERVFSRQFGLKNYDELVEIVSGSGLDMPVVKYTVPTDRSRGLYIRKSDREAFDEWISERFKK